NYGITAVNNRLEFVPGGGLPSLRMLFYGGSSPLMVDALDLSTRYSEEQSRGYEHEGTLWSPGYFHVDFDHGSTESQATLVASTESWETVEALSPASAADSELTRRRHLVSQAPVIAREGLRAELVVAADQFLVSPASRPEESTRAAALGSEARTVIAGYHWFTDWGRDTMISLEGLTLATGRSQEAALILNTFAGYMRDGLLPYMFSH